MKPILKIIFGMMDGNFPDFYLPKYDAYIEVKGYKTERDDAKWSQFNGILIIVDLSIINKLDEYTIDDLIEQASVV